ncbi:transcription antitermination factor NusB [Arenibacter sp. GZD96]|uniref:transcription antitermination factor NusB n=1 Tax=Aurantibrevibacter litoralis TaxID=3106030 RepID=UPI002AFFD708|nr:transcription antitermination factor NusB [Arenibacter sp. GZD-96]MEA1787055.1 transcription antitermination factor NusB [Arenibacter sp. GZD-96]
MLTRRHLRVKVMQCIYAKTLSKDESIDRQRGFLEASIENTYNLYLLMLSLLVEVHAMASEQIQLSAKKYLANASDTYPNRKKFIENEFLVMLSQNKSLQYQLAQRKLKNWYLNEEYVKIVYKEIVESEMYQKYMKKAKHSFEEDKELVLYLFKEIIAPNDKIYDYLEDDKLTWVDDIPIVNTYLYKLLKKAKPDQKDTYFLPRLLKDEADLEFAGQLLSQTLLHREKWEKEMEGKTPNWDKERIADIDSILLKMAICELLSFSSIPEKVTLNEFVEIAKEYSTPKSSIFINGILDKLVKEYQESGKLKKEGRGLL